MKSILNTLATVVIVIVQVVFWASFAKMNGWRLTAPLKALSEFMRCRGKVGSLFFAALIAITGYRAATKQFFGPQANASQMMMLAAPQLPTIPTPSYGDDGIFPEYAGVVTNQLVTGFMLGPTSAIMRSEWSWRESGQNRRIEVYGTDDLQSGTWAIFGEAAAAAWSEKVIYEIPYSIYPAGWGSSVFFRTGFYADTDDDGLSDMFELLVSKTNPEKEDSDDDGIPDGWEFYHGLDPNAADSCDDSDEDGLANWQEYLAGTRLDSADSDGDRLSDADEIGTVAVCNETMWFDMTGATELFTRYSTFYSDTAPIALPSSATFGGKAFTNAVVSSSGGIALLMPWNPRSSWLIPSDYYGLSKYLFSTNQILIAGLGSYLYGDHDREGSVRYGLKSRDGKRYSVFEYCNVCHYYERNTNAECGATFQIVLPENEPDTFYVSYDHVSSCFTNYDVAVGVQMVSSFVKHREDKYYWLKWNRNPACTETPFTLKFKLGTRSDALEYDSDGDGLNDGREIGIGTDPMAADSDEDGLSDGMERNQGMNPLARDTDEDGLPDQWEVLNDLNPLVDDRLGDLDGDGLSNKEECLLGTSPIDADSDGDGLSDDIERAYFESGVNLVPWFEFTPTLTRTAVGFTTGLTSCNMPFSTSIAGTHANLVIADAYGTVYFGNSSITNGMYTRSCSEFRGDIDVKCPMVAGYWADLSLRTELGSKIDFGVSEYEGRRYFVVQFDNLRIGGRNVDKATFQVSVAEDVPNVVYVRYGSVTDSRNGYLVSIGAVGVCDRKNRNVPNLKYAYLRSPQEITEGHTIVYHMGAGSDPCLADTDGDGVLDADEVAVGSNPHVVDSDRDGLADGWEIEHGLSPWRSDGVHGAKGDLDGDGVINSREYEYGTNPANVNTDADGLDDGDEVGYITSDGAIPWLSFDAYVDQTAALAAVENGSRSVTWQLPSEITVQDRSVGSLTFTSRGWLMLNPSGYSNTGLTSGSESLTYNVKSATLALAFNGDSGTRVRLDLPNPTVVRSGTATYGEKGYALVEYERLYRDVSSSGTNSLSVQIAIPTNASTCAYVRYRNVTGQYVDGRNATVGLQSLGGKWRCVYSYRESGSIHSELALKYVWGANTEPRNPDTDGDGLTDGEELALGTKPTIRDSDGDGIDDGWEVANAMNPLEPSDGSLDFDDDGLTNLYEFMYGSNPRSEDGDDDGLSDGLEVMIGTDPMKDDTDEDGLGDGFEYASGYDPVDPDMDRDGMLDGWEVDNALDPNDSSDAEGDEEPDGLTNAEEYANGCNPRESDSDGDTVPDVDEVRNGSNPADASDGGVAPPVSQFREIAFDIGGDWAAWEMTVRGEGPFDFGVYRFSMQATSKSVERILRLRKGNRYCLTMKWLNCGNHDDDLSPWYCWRAKIDGLPNGTTYASYSNTRLPGNELITGDGWIALNDDGLLTGHVCESTRKSDGSFGGGNVAGGLSATLFVLGDITLTPDYDRDGQISSGEVEDARNGRVLRFWKNDDEDEESTDLKYSESPSVDLPGAQTGWFEFDGRDPDAEDRRVNGYRDLVDFTPVKLDVSSLLSLPPSIRRRISYRLEHDEYGVNVVWSNASMYNVGTFQSGSDVLCGKALEESPHRARADHIGPKGVRLPKSLTNLMETPNTDKGIVYVEGRRSTISPLRLVAYLDGDKKVAEGQLPLCITSVEDMYWFRSLRGAENNDNFEASTNDPRNLMDGMKDVDAFFMHGFNVDYDAARSWGSEVFKRLWQSGSRARFHMVTWPGDYHWTLEAFSAFHYQHDVYLALKCGRAYKRLVEGVQSDSTKRVLMAQSLGNMVTCAAIRDGLLAKTYMMFNAAVASESFDAALQNATPEIRAKYVPDEWDEYDEECWASNWYKLFAADPTDSRSKMGWPNMFRCITDRVTAVRNFYSDGDRVFAEEDETPWTLSGLWHWPTFRFDVDFVDWNMTPEHASWQKQETLKGVNGIAGTLEGGWAFHLITEVNDRGEVSYRKYSTTEAHAKVSDNSIKEHPVFRYAGTELCNRDASIDEVYYALAKQIPAVSSATGKLTLPNSEIISYNLNTQSYRHGWGRRTDGVYENDWLHSDMKDMGYNYVSPLYTIIVNEGSLK